MAASAPAAALATRLAGTRAAALATSHGGDVVLAVSAILASSTVLAGGHFYIKNQHFFRARWHFEKSYNVK